MVYILIYRTDSSEFPLFWSPQENDIEIVTLDKGKEEYRSIRDSFLLSMPESCVVAVERIQNKKLYIRYAFQKALLLDKNSGKTFSRIALLIPIANE
jgi:spore cortex formation protein SpoVR/YcgB (stage V sporulation)